MTSLVVQHSMQDESLLAKDRYVNTFHLSTTGTPDAALFTFISTTIHAFYEVAHAGTASLDTFLSAQVNGAGSTLKIYDLDGAPPHPPLFVDTFTKAVGTGPGLPSEVAICLSLHTNPVSGIPKGRLRGRLYIGPLDTSAVQVGVPNTGRPGNALIASLGQAAIATQAAFHAHSPAVSWCVYSPTLRGTSPTAAAALHGITSVSVDDAWDTQRRRGVQPSAKYSYPTP